MKPRFLTSHYSWIQGCYWMAYCILLSFSSVYLLDQGFSNTHIGLLLGLSGLLTALLQPFVGARADHLKVLSLGQFAALLILAMLLCTGGLLLLPGQTVQGGLFLSLLILLQLLTSLLYALGMDCVNQGMPLNFGLEADGGTVRLYFHGADTGTKYDLIARNPNASFEMDRGHELILDDEHGNCTMTYESVIGQGRITVVPDSGKEHALRVLMAQYRAPDFPFSTAVIPRTTVLCLTVEHMTGKRRVKKHG